MTETFLIHTNQIPPGYIFNKMSQQNISPVYEYSSNQDSIKIDLGSYLDANIDKVNIILKDIVTLPPTNFYLFEITYNENIPSKYIDKKFTLFFDTVDNDISNDKRIYIRTGGRAYIGTEIFDNDINNKLSGMILVLKSNGRQFFILSFAPGSLQVVD